MQMTNDTTTHSASAEPVHTETSAILWRGPWVSDLDGIYETRAVVSAGGAGFLPGLEVSFQGGEPTSSAEVDEVGDLPSAIEAALALGCLWHRNNADLH
ncbi:hypothetical protein AB4Z46_31550 [Variovorax sp. M-6]|uniref:hypothetical protein n=1 Tax=Variovorax sp. M-6 TaxID=3233041 RepID=UPI003F99CFEF